MIFETLTFKNRGIHELLTVLNFDDLKQTN